MKKAFLFLTAIMVLHSLYTFAMVASREFYQIKVYHLKTTDQEQVVDDFLKQAYLPALHRAGIAKIGVFKYNAQDLQEKLIYVFIPFKSYKIFEKLEPALEKDLQFQKDGANYLNAAHNKRPYERMESILLNAFSGNPNFNLPKLSTPLSERVYELRSYEGPTEKLFKNKVDMFNKGDEIGLFKRLNFNAVFYGEVVAGSRMPNLMYLTTFENKADREAHWKAFGEDAYWKKLSAMPEYQNNMLRNDTRLLTVADYSDF
ncbi:NIPSNAP family protein [Pedobacter sp. GR22-6]|uniref:NIPSNAP family protein n=1 Tax=Pedobacter sp. GR22-6 TaxID=3127957 RepID=UPI00307E5DB1